MTLRAKTPQSLLKENNLDAYLLPKWGEYLGELALPTDQRLEAVTGFTGSAGFAIILPSKTLLVVDGRYTEQAPKEVKPGVLVIEGGLATFSDILQDHLPTNAKIGLCENHFSYAQLGALEKKLSEWRMAFFKTCLFQNWFTNKEFVPTFKPKQTIIDVPLKVATFTTAEKIEQLFKAVETDWYFIHDPEELCWL